MPRRSLWPVVLKAIAGFVLGFAIWWGLRLPYNNLLAAAAEPILRAAERPPVTRLRAETESIVVDRSDFPVRSARPGVPAHDLTFNFILLTTLFAASPRPFSNRSVVGFLLAVLVLFFTHLFGFVAAVKAIYAVQLGAWSSVHYGPLARNFWAGTSHFYRLVGIYAIAFALWWLFRADVAVPPAKTATSQKRRRKK